MDMTPPSLTASPSSPLQKSIESPSPFLYSTYYMPETSADIYPSLPLFDHSFLPQPYGSMDPAALVQSIEESSFSSLDPVAQTAVSWPSPSIADSATPPMTHSSTMSGMLPSDFEQFGQYESSCFSPSYISAAPYQRTTTQSPAYMQTPPPSSTDVKSRVAAFPSDTFATMPNGTRFHGYQPATPQFGSGNQVFADFQCQTQMPPQTSLQMHSPASSQFSTPAPTNLTITSSTIPSSAMSTPESRAWNRLKAKRRPARKHTTKEEANFQCMVRGCGKFFSRSYNFKSHMETHDDKREYPFPCQVAKCTKKFVRKTDLQRHHQSVHTKERNHKCNYCGRLFARKDTQRRHMEDGCSKRFDLGMLESQAESYNGTVQSNSQTGLLGLNLSLNGNTNSLGV